jgi:hypothetical protein
MWQPYIETARGARVPVEGVEQLCECPVSYIKPESQELIQIWARSRSMYETCGASLLGPDLRKWPARMVDAFTTLEAERLRRDNAEVNAGRDDVS